ncbi:putative Na(+)/H(+) exchange regulatory cofactor NHE-RF1-like isoform X1 [Penaeus vannamei]|uniref:Putative Na(+)/H(+) exchange regulatory cofactor NHE-RF1-like isoform X1 n=1 Tax=Penaeus vannamei TaxID=6689 RepID=A0A423SUA8_PENVA|nr:putative Na(+)/H(+) exchange regulatory cofactor NHE-RF1-like isoform X1 [Penaeus vannamei]
MAGTRRPVRLPHSCGGRIAFCPLINVVQRIKAVSNETRLLVLDAEADKYYKAKNIVVRGGQSNVVTKSSVRAPPSPATPEPPATNGHHQDDADARSVSSAASSSAASEASTQPQSPMSTSPTPPPSLDNTSSNTAKSTPTPTRTPRPRHQSHHHHHLLLFLFSSQHPRPHACSVSGLQQCLQLERPEPEHVRGRDAGDAGPQEEGRPSQGHLRPAEKIRDHPEHHQPGHRGRHAYSTPICMHGFGPMDHFLTGRSAGGVESSASRRVEAKPSLLMSRSHRPRFPRCCSPGEARTPTGPREKVQGQTWPE